MPIPVLQWDRRLTKRIWWNMHSPCSWIMILRSHLKWLIWDWKRTRVMRHSTVWRCIIIRTWNALKRHWRRRTLSLMNVIRRIILIWTICITDICWKNWRNMMKLSANMRRLWNWLRQRRICIRIFLLLTSRKMIIKKRSVHIINITRLSKRKSRLLICSSSWADFIMVQVRNSIRWLSMLKNVSRHWCLPILFSKWFQRPLRIAI